MALDRIHLRKLLMILYLPDNKRISVLRNDIRERLKKDTGEGSGGGDFHAPFWADVKEHVARRSDLREQTKVRVALNRRRQRLYPLLSTGFLSWWNEKRRWKNEAFDFIDGSIGARFPIPELASIIKVENFLALNVGDQSRRLIYPYFSEEPALNTEGARIGLWVLKQSLTEYHIDDFRILDVLRGTSFGTIDCPLRGNERDLLLQKYRQVLNEWNTLKDEY